MSSVGPVWLRQCNGNGLKTKKGEKGEWSVVVVVVVVGHSTEFKRESSALVQKNLLDSLFHCHPNSTPLLEFNCSDRATDLETMLSRWY